MEGTFCTALEAFHRAVAFNFNQKKWADNRRTGGGGWGWGAIKKTELCDVQREHLVQGIFMAQVQQCTGQ